MKQQNPKPGKPSKPEKSLEKSLDKATVKSLRQPDDRSEARGQENQGEGNREAARRYNEDQQQFVQSGRAEAAAGRAAPDDADDAAEMSRAEREGRRHAKGEDPTVPGANSRRPGRDELGDGD